MRSFILAAIAAVLLAVPANAQNQCRDYNEYRSAIETQGSEVLTLIGVSALYAPKGVTRVEVYFNPETGTLSYMFIRPVEGGEQMCLGDFGKFRFATEGDADKGEPT